ncbi:uncharacterized protein LOC128957848 [Oppia nitens]|uniref:uncharacterized protein LOC128957848 n=1 Tax=Oppia nitens TaxID=1686743 RepID=UPI0023DCE329|nr:uncharacterized protein LOC128957848 [Oppia nitens]
MRIYTVNSDHLSHHNLNDKSVESSEMSSSSLSSNRISSSASSSASSSVNFATNCRKTSVTSVNSNKPNVSFEMFIKSKGNIASKDNKLYSPYSGLNDNSLINKSCGVYYELKPPMFVKQDLKTFKRRVSAISMIQEELKQMKAREDELRWRSVRLIGLSQPNLSTLCDETDESLKEELSQSSDQSLLSRANSNPNLIDKEVNEEKPTIKETGCLIGGPRRRTALIAVWEQKIQKTNN